MNWTMDDMVEITLKDPEDFLKVKETLTRIGVASRREKKLFQSCHILHKRGRYYIVHFKELFALDGKPATLSEGDFGRRNKITTLIVEWGLADLVISFDETAPMAYLSQIKVIPFKEKETWELIPKYSIGKNSYSDGEDV